MTQWVSLGSLKPSSTPIDCLEISKVIGWIDVVVKPVLYGVIYKITNTVTGQSYIGQTCGRPEKRWSTHKSEGRWGKRRTGLSVGMREHGIDSFTFEVLRECGSRGEMDEWEKAYIDAYRTLVPEGYNVEAGGHYGDRKGRMSKGANVRIQSGDRRGSPEARMRQSDSMRRWCRKNRPKGVGIRGGNGKQAGLFD